MSKKKWVVLWVVAVTVPLVAGFWAGSVFGEIIAESEQKLFFATVGRERPEGADRSLLYIDARQRGVWLGAVWRRVQTEDPKIVAEWLFMVMRNVESPKGVETLSELSAELGADAAKFDGASRQLLNEMVQLRAALPAAATDARLSRYFALLETGAPRLPLLSD